MLSLADVPDGIDYAGQTTTGVSVTVDSQANDGQPGEGDDVRNVEIVGGTVHSDKLVGSPFPELLVGTPGGSQLVKPVLVSDTLQGFGGGDLIDARGGAKDVISCGSGSDIATLDLVDPAVPDCEAVERAAINQHPPVLIRRLRVRGGRALVRLAVPGRRAAPAPADSPSAREEAGSGRGDSGYAARGRAACASA